MNDWSFLYSEWDENRLSYVLLFLHGMNQSPHYHMMAQIHSKNILRPSITMTSHWARWRLKSPASRLFTQPYVQGADQRKHQSSASLAFVRGNHRWPVNSCYKGPVTRKMTPFDDVVMMVSKYVFKNKNENKETVFRVGTYKNKTTLAPKWSLVPDINIAISHKQ